MQPSTNPNPTAGFSAGPQPQVPVTMPPENSMQQPVAMPPKPKSKKLLFIIIGVAVALIIAGGVWFWANNAANQFVSAVPGYESRTKEAHDYFMSLKDRLTHGKDINDKFNQAIASAPQEPKLLGLSLVPADKSKRVNDLTSAMQKFKTAYVNAADVTTYSEGAITEIASVTGVLNSVDAMKAIMPKLQQAKAAIAALQPPEPVKQFHADLLAKYDTAIKDTGDAITAYEASDGTAYSQSVNKLAPDFKALSVNAARDELSKIFDANYGQADTALGELQQLLGIS
jgi:hypothetical protein